MARYLNSRKTSAQLLFLVAICEFATAYWYHPPASSCRYCPQRPLSFYPIPCEIEDASGSVVDSRDCMEAYQRCEVRVPLVDMAGDTAYTFIFCSVSYSFDFAESLQERMRATNCHDGRRTCSNDNVACSGPLYIQPMDSRPVPISFCLPINGPLSFEAFGLKGIHNRRRTPSPGEPSCPPEQPETTEQPEIPEQPETPEQPDTPEQPETPEIPEDTTDIIFIG